MRNRRKMRSQMDAIDQINVTPLLDLTFLLLIVFMITMPLMEYGTSIKPPEMNAEKLPDDNFKSVTLTNKGTIMFGDSVVTQEELIEHLRQRKVAEPKTSLLLRADGSRTYKDVIELMAAIRRSGFEDVTLVTAQEGR